jgi:hypothetical protein
MTSCKRTSQAQFTGKHSRSDDAGELLRVLAWFNCRGSTHAEEVEHGSLWLEDRAAANSSDFNAGHGHGDVKITITTGIWLVFC